MSRNKVQVLICSILLTLIIIVLYLKDIEWDWSLYKIFSCIIASIFTFFVIPSYIYMIRMFNEKCDIFKSIQLGVIFGFLFFFIPILISPYAGVKYYLDNRF